MDPLALLACLALGTVAGLLIGCVGIGGVVVVPALVYLGELSPQHAIAATLCAFLVSGVVGLYAYARAGSILWRAAAFTWLGALPLAFAGAALANALQPFWLELAIALLTAGSGIYTLARRGGATGGSETLPSGAGLLGLGAVTGLLSALTGTGGPLVLVPALVWLDVPLLAAIGLGQAIQVPVAAAATAGNLLAGAVDWRLSVALACGLAFGTWSGAKAAHRVPTRVLRGAVAALLVAIGAVILARTLAQPWLPA